MSCCQLGLGLVSYEVCQELSYAVAQTVPYSSRSVVIIASTDMTHLCRAIHCVNLPLPSLPPAYPEATGRPDAEWIM
jgi:AmmeMemoRadiSam system protein B